MKILTKKGALDLSADFSIQIDNKSPINNDEASQSVPVTIPATPKNARITDFPFRPDLAIVPMGGDAPCAIQDGSYRRTGQMHVVSASRKAGITINIGFDNAEAYAKWKSSYMQELPDLPVIPLGSAAQAAVQLERIMADPDLSDDMAVFPVLVSATAKNGVRYAEYLNLIEEDGDGYYHLVYESRTVQVLYNDNPVNTTLPTGYGCTPFLYVGKILEVLFDTLGYKVRKNPFREDPELSRIVVLNNTADAIVTGNLYYADLMPSVSVEDFLQALYMRFGMVYQLENETNTVRIELIRDLLETDAQINISDFEIGRPTVTFTDKKQVKLTPGLTFADDNIQERYEDFRKGQAALSSCKVLSGSFIPTSMFIELTTGNIYKWDGDNNIYQGQSANFFRWDRQTKGVEAEDIVSVDEAVQMVKEFATPTPKYPAGYAHRHTYIRSTSDSVKDDTGTDTPLVFLLALPIVTRKMRIAQAEKTVLGGTIMPYDVEGNRIKIGGKDFSFTLLMTFSDGIFATFWKKYDAILRHAANEIETEVRLPVFDLMTLNMLDPMLYHGQRLLPDTVSYSLPGGSKVKANVKMRSLNLVGSFNLAEEQGLSTATPGEEGGGGEVIPETSLAWKVKRSYLEDNASTVIQERLEEYNTEPVNGWTYAGYHWGTMWYWYEYEWQNNGIDSYNYTNPYNDDYLKNNPPTEAGQTLRRTYTAKQFFSVWGKKYYSEQAEEPWPGSQSYPYNDFYDSFGDEYNYAVEFEAVEI